MVVVTISYGAYGGTELHDMIYSFTEYTEAELADLIADTEQQLAAWARIAEHSKLLPHEIEQVTRNEDLLAQAIVALRTRTTT